MFKVTSVLGNKIGVVDTKDNVEEFFTSAELLKALNLGIEINGLTDKILWGTFKDSALEMAKRLLVDSIWKSANLEGLGTTFPKTEAILENIPTQTSRDEVLFILNMKNAWNFLLDTLDYPIQLDYLRQLNKLCGEGLFCNNGIVRVTPVQIGGTTWTSSLPNITLIKDKLVKLNQITDIRLRALKLFCFLTRSQIFIDGNKRLAQLVCNKVLIEANIGIFQVPIEKLEDFKTLLIAYYESGNDSDIISFMKKFCLIEVK